MTSLSLNADLNYSKLLADYEFKIGFMKKMTMGMIEGSVNTFLVSGTPGVGKSFNLEQLLEKYEEEGIINYKRISGRITPFAFYEALHESASRKDLLFFDDCDSILWDDQSLNILKAAAELKKARTISWMSSRNSIDNQFVYEGKILIATNIRMRDNPHFDAVMDRFHVYELDVSLEEKLVKIIDISKNFDDIKEICSDELISQLVEFIMSRRDRINAEKFTLRTFIKLVELSTLLPDDWHSYAEVGKYIPLMEE